jgi:hypothetical protein
MYSINIFSEENPILINNSSGNQKPNFSLRSNYVTHVQAPLKRRIFFYFLRFFSGIEPILMKFVISVKFLHSKRASSHIISSTGHPFVLSI